MISKKELKLGRLSILAIATVPCDLVLERVIIFFSAINLFLNVEKSKCRFYSVERERQALNDNLPFKVDVFPILWILIENVSERL